MDKFKETKLGIVKPSDFFLEEEEKARWAVSGFLGMDLWDGKGSERNLEKFHVSRFEDMVMKLACLYTGQYSYCSNEATSASKIGLSVGARVSHTKADGALVCYSTVVGVGEYKKEATHALVAEANEQLASFQPSILHERCGVVFGWTVCGKEFSAKQIHPFVADFIQGSINDFGFREQMVLFAVKMCSVLAAIEPTLITHPMGVFGTKIDRPRASVRVMPKVVVKDYTSSSSISSMHKFYSATKAVPFLEKASWDGGHPKRFKLKPSGVASTSPVELRWEEDECFTMLCLQTLFALKGVQEAGFSFADFRKENIVYSGQINGHPTFCIIDAEFATKFGESLEPKLKVFDDGVPVREVAEETLDLALYRLWLRSTTAAHRIFEAILDLSPDCNTCADLWVHLAGSGEFGRQCEVVAHLADPWIQKVSL